MNIGQRTYPHQTSASSSIKRAPDHACLEGLWQSHTGISVSQSIKHLQGYFAGGREKQVPSSMPSHGRHWWCKLNWIQETSFNYQRKKEIVLEDGNHDVTKWCRKQNLFLINRYKNLISILSNGHDNKINPIARALRHGHFHLKKKNYKALYMIYNYSGT